MSAGPCLAVCPSLADGPSLAFGPSFAVGPSLAAGPCLNVCPSLAVERVADSEGSADFVIAADLAAEIADAPFTP